MFWRSIVEGLGSLLDWHILVGIFGVAATSLIVPAFGGFLMGKGDSASRNATGCLTTMLGGPLAQGCAIALFVLFCLPSLIGRGAGFTPLGIASLLWTRVLIAAGLALLAVVFLAIVPVVGQLVAATPGVTVAIQGILVLRMLSATLFTAINQTEIPDAALPGLWTCIAFIALGTVACYCVTLGSALLATLVQAKRPSTDTGGAMLMVGLAGGSIAGLLPVLMYGRYVAASFH